MARDRTDRVSRLGQPGSSGLSGCDAPLIGAPAAIAIDAIVERESGVTPPPPAISVRTVAIALGLMLLIGLGINVAFMAAAAPEPIPAGRYEKVWIESGVIKQIDGKTRFRLQGALDASDEDALWFASPTSATEYFVDGRPVTATEFGSSLRASGWLPVDVEADAAGTVSRLDVFPNGVITTGSDRE